MDREASALAKRIAQIPVEELTTIGMSVLWGVVMATNATAQMHALVTTIKDDHAVQGKPNLSTWNYLSSVLFRPSEKASVSEPLALYFLSVFLVEDISILL